MPYEVTATRKRPPNFDQLVGQEFVVATLRSSLEQGRIAHAYLFSGPRGVGKTSAARILAKALNCETGPTSAPCGSCSACQEIARGESLDVIEIDGASNTSVNDVREIKDEVLFAPNSSRYKIYIIDEVHMLSNSAFNALLKTIEEPPPYVVFIFATTEIHRVPATIRSRCQQFNFRLLSIDVIKRCLAEVCEEAGLKAEDAALLWIAKEATGSLRDAYTLLDQVVSFSDGGITLEQIRDKLGVIGLDQLNDLVEAFADQDPRKALQVLDEAMASGVPPEQFVIDLVEYFRSLLFLQHDLGKESFLGHRPESFSETATRAFSTTQVEKAIELLLELYRNLRYSLNQRFEVELVVSRLSHLGQFIPNPEILQQIRSIRADFAAGGAASDGTSRAETATGKEEIGVSGTPLPPPPAGQESETSDPSEDKGSSSTGDSPEELATRVVEVIRRKKLALASAMDKAERMTVEAGVLQLQYNRGDRYSGETVMGDRSSVERASAEVLGKTARLEVVYIDGATDAVADTVSVEDEKVEIVKRVFKGEVVEGE